MRRIERIARAVLKSGTREDARRTALALAGDFVQAKIEAVRHPARPVPG